MWWSDRRRFLAGLAAAAALPGCGFRPALAPGTAAAELAGAVGLDPPEGRDGYAMMARLEARLGRARAPRYHLATRIAVRRTGLAITQDEETTRYNLIGTARYTLTETATGAIAAQGSVRNFTAYSARGTTLATTSAERDARARLMVILADMIVTRLMLDIGRPGAVRRPDPAALDALDERLEDEANAAGVL